MVARNDYLPSIDDYFDTKFINLFSKASKNIQQLFLQALAEGKYEQAKSLSDRIKQIQTTMKAEYSTRSELRIQEEYLKGLEYVEDYATGASSILQLQHLPIKDYQERIAFVENSIQSLGPIHIEAVNALINEEKSYVYASIDGISRNVDYVLSQVHRADIREEIATGMIEGRDLQRQKAALIKMFSEKGVGGFRDKAGRYWSLDRYSEMLVRTETTTANVQGTIDRGLKSGITTFEIIEQVDCCHICQRYKGKIVDIAEKGYADLPPYHPNCRGYIVIAQNKIHSITDRKDTAIPKRVKSPTLESALDDMRLKYTGKESPIGSVNEAVLLDYTRTANQFLNMNLRQNTLTQENKFYLQVMDKLFKNLPSSEGLLYRGTSLPDDQYKKLLTLSTYYDKGYMSTSKASDVAREFMRSSGAKNNVLFVIDGASGIDIEKYSQYGMFEEEVLINRGTLFIIEDRMKIDDYLVVKLKDG